MIRTVENLQKIIDGAFEKRAELSPHTAAAEIIDAVGETLSLLNNGTLRVATPAADGDGWVVHEWLKKAVLLSFRLFNNRVMAGGETRYFDKVSLKFSRFEEARFQSLGRPRSAAGDGAPRRLYRPQCRFDAVLCQHRRLCGFRRHGGYLGNRRFLCTNWQECSPIRRCRHRRRFGTVASDADNY